MSIIEPPSEILECLDFREEIFIHKINRKSHWFAEEDLESRVQKAVELIFNHDDETYSFWKVKHQEDLFSIAVSLNAGRDSSSEPIDFIWFTQEDLDGSGINNVPENEGVCLHSRNLHYNAYLNGDLSSEFCRALMTDSNRHAKLTKSMMKKVNKYMESKGCYALRGSAEAAQDLACSCEHDLSL